MLEELLSKQGKACAYTARTDMGFETHGERH